MIYTFQIQKRKKTTKDLDLIDSMDNKKFLFFFTVSWWGGPKPIKFSNSIQT